MKQKLYFLTFLFSLFATLSFAQSSDDDNIDFLRVQQNDSMGNYAKSLQILRGMSEQGKENNFYLSYSAECHEHLKNFDSAEYYYKKLYSVTKTFDVMKKVAEMKDKKEARQNCTQCNGTGHYYEVFTCTFCKGIGHYYCEICGGTGYRKCTTCDGSGYHGETLVGGFDKKCTDCNGYGKTKCDSCHGTGKRGKCAKCEGTGKESVLRVCKLHD